MLDDFKISSWQDIWHEKSPGWLELIEFTFLLLKKMGVNFPRELSPPTKLPKPSI